VKGFDNLILPGQEHFSLSAHTQTQDRGEYSGLGSLHTPGTSYRGPWRLPGPDAHRLAALSLSLGYTTNSFLVAPELLDARPTPKVAGRWVYLYRAIDQYGQVIDVLVSRKRDLAATRRFFTRASTTVNTQPR
jgi:DDE domain